MNAETQRRYRYWRGFGLPAKSALSYVREEDRQRAVLARFGTWQFEHGSYGTFAYADLEDDTLPYVLRVLVGDDDSPDDGIDWDGATEGEIARVNAARSTYYVAVVVLDDAGEELYHDGIGGVDIIDLPGYLGHDWEDAAAYALLDYLLSDAEHFARNEDAERAYWAARDVETV